MPLTASLSCLYVTSTLPPERFTVAGTRLRTRFRNHPECTNTVCGTSMKFSTRFVTPFGNRVTMKYTVQSG